jgi:uncharacterized membrane protein
VPAHAQELTLDVTTQIRAQVTDILASHIEIEPISHSSITKQKLRVKLLEGSELGNVVDIDNDYQPLAVGDEFYVLHRTNAADGTNYYGVGDPYRLPTLMIFCVLFVILVVVFGGWQGVRGLASFIGGVVVIGYVLFPGIIAGYSPIVLSIGVASLIIVLGSYITHGFTKTTSCAVFGMIIAIILTGLLAHAGIEHAHLRGFATEESMYLNTDTEGRINFAGLLLGGMIIGLLGVLYDAAIGQAVAVAELHAIAPTVARSTIFRRAMRIGREHIGALMNSLAIAYVGASLPMLLLVFHSYASPLPVLMNMELIATEILRTLVGSIGLVLAVPITTIISVLWLVPASATSHNEHALDAAGSHGHSH